MGLGSEQFKPVAYKGFEKGQVHNWNSVFVGFKTFTKNENLTSGFPHQEFAIGKIFYPPAVNLVYIFTYLK